MTAPYHCKALQHTVLTPFGQACQSRDDRPPLSADLGGLVDRCSGCSSAALTESVGGRPEQALAEGPSRLSDTVAVLVVVTGVSVSAVR